MISLFRASLVATLGLMTLTGLAYPLAVTGVCQLVWPQTANGSLATAPDGAVVGSALIGQAFSSPGFFWGRPSSAGSGYDAQSSSPSNLGPTSQKLSDSFGAEAARARADGVTGVIPGDRLTGSGSGLDPDISIDNALGQVPRVAQARGLDQGTLRGLIQAQAQGRTFGLWGEPRVNVLALNRALPGVK
jgi:K+-transporting ATPase ATPase C chain